MPQLNLTGKHGHLPAISGTAAAWASIACNVTAARQHGCRHRLLAILLQRVSMAIGIDCLQVYCSALAWLLAYQGFCMAGMHSSCNPLLGGHHIPQDSHLHLELLNNLASLSSLGLQVWQNWYDRHRSCKCIPQLLTVHSCLCCHQLEN